MARLFFAAPIAPTLQTTIASFVKKLQKQALPVCWSLPENWHLTIRFLGQTLPEKIEVCIEQAKKVLQVIDPFEFNLGQPMLFPINCPRLLVIQVPLSSALRELHQMLEAAMHSIGFEPDAYDFFPHITLGKLQHTLELPLDLILPPVSQRVDQIILFESGLKSKENRYKIICPLSLH